MTYSAPAARRRVARKHAVLLCGLMLAALFNTAARANSPLIFGSGEFEFYVDFTAGTVHLKVPQVINTSGSYTSGSIKLTVWAASKPYDGGEFSGYLLATHKHVDFATGLTQLMPGESFSVDATEPLTTTPPQGNYYVFVLLEEYFGTGPQCASSSGYCVDDSFMFSNLLDVPSEAGGGGSGSCDWLLVLLLASTIVLRLCGRARRRTEPGNSCVTPRCPEGARANLRALLSVSSKFRHRSCTTP